MLRALIWKDVLANRFPLFLAASLLVTSYGGAAIFHSLDASLTALSWGRRLDEIVLAGSLFSHGLAQLSLAVLSGNLIASERVNRSAEFLAYLPPSRGMVLSAKAAVLGGAAVVLLIIPISILGLAALLGGSHSGEGYQKVLSIVAYISALGFCASGIGWLGSCCLQSNAVAILFAILTPWIVAIAITTVSRGAEAMAILIAANLAIGLAGFLFGTRHYLNRVEP
jgi:ABC-type transport system involved in multi-copper enzyme maturation permease subunit